MIYNCKALDYTLKNYEISRRRKSDILAVAKTTIAVNKELDLRLKIGNLGGFLAHKLVGVSSTL
jgi:hypothetical protein